MKKKLVDKNLLAEGLIQLKIPGIILFVISFLGTLVLPVSRLFNILKFKNKGLAIPEELLMPININEISPMITLFMYFAPFIFTLILFSFLNKRNSSDFYHSLAYHRITIFNSFAVAIMLWFVFTIIICIVTGSIIYCIAGIYVKFSYIMWLIGTLLSGALLVMSCTLLAMTITGTLFTNIILSGIIFFLPRFILLMFSKTLTYSVKILMLKDTNITNYNNNIPIKLIFHIFEKDNINPNALYSSASAIIYTLSLAVIYYLIAYLLFNMRKSEIAGTSAPNRILQHCYSCIIVLPFALAIPIILILRSVNSKPIYITILIILSMFVFYIYELLTTKSIKKSFKATPFLSVVAALTVVFGVTLNISKNCILNFTPSASEIKYVTFLPSNSSGLEEDYYTIAASNINYSEDNIKFKIADILKTNVDSIKKEGYYYKNSFIPVKITLKNGKSAERLLYMTSNEYLSITDSMMKNEKYMDIMKNLPPDNTISEVYSNELGISMNIWNSYKKEFAELPDSVKRNHIMTAQYAYQDDSLLTNNDFGAITVMGSLNMLNYVSNYRITKDTPETARLYINRVNSDNKSEFKGFIESTDNDDTIYSLNINIINNNESNNKGDNKEPDNYISLSDKSYSDNSVKNIIKIMKKHSSADQINLSETFIKVSCSSSNHDFSYFLPVSSDDVNELMKYKSE